jgi:O-antigen/teichoic acid export membrane protein
MDPKLRQSSRFDYLSTVTVAAGNIVAAVIVSAILARTWTVSEFLLYSTCSRYLSLLFCVTSFSLGFGVVQYYAAEHVGDRRAVLLTAIATSMGLCLLVGVPLLAFAGEISEFLQANFAEARVAASLACIWLIGLSLLHVMLAFLRATGQVALSNWLQFHGQTLSLLVVAVVGWCTPLSVPGYFAAVGGLVIAGCLLAGFSQSAPISARIDVGLSRRLVAFSSSRFADALLKHLSHAAIITLLLVWGHHVLAGQMALLQCLLRGLESLFQPLVLLVFADCARAGSADIVRRQAQAMWNAVLVAAAVVLPATSLFGQALLGLWLGPEYRELGAEFSIAAIGFAPTAAIVLLRGYLEGNARISPIAVLNAADAAIVVASACALHASGLMTLMNLVLVLAVSRWLQLGAVLWILAKRHQVRLLEPDLLRTVLQAAGRRLS